MAPGALRVTRVAPIFCALTVFGWASGLLSAESGAPEPEAAPIFAALDAFARRPPVSYTARRRLDAELVEKAEHAWMEVVTRFDPERGVTHDVLAEGGSQRIRTRALEAVLKKEIEVARGDERKRAALSSENYRYRLLDAPWDGACVELLPLRSDARLLKGTAQVDPEDGALLKVEGRLSDNPSFWVRDVYVARTYGRVGNDTLPIELVSTARVRLFGAARLRIRNEYISVDGQAVRSTDVTTLASK
jgi:hypothetical protein